jgi:ATP-dependent helicase/DNAse subunit B
MKTDFGALKKELGRLTDINYLKKEIKRVTIEVKKFDVHAHLNPKSRERLEHLEERFATLLKTLQHLQVQVDSSLDKFIALVKKNSDLNKTKKAAPKSTKVKSATSKRSAGKVAASGTRTSARKAKPT